MKLLLNCMTCCHTPVNQPTEAMHVELRDDSLYSVVCPNGHETVTAIQEEKFQILFELGAMALLDGYPREAIASIAAALERFYEYYIWIVCLKRKIMPQHFCDTWHSVAAQSERQLGAFFLLYLLENNKPLDQPITDAKPDVSLGLKQRLTWTEFRNKVIHKGYIPSTGETLVYGDLVYQFIYRLIHELKATCSQFIVEATFQRLKQCSEASGGIQINTMSIPTAINTIRTPQSAGSFREALKSLETYRRWLYQR